MCRMCDNKLLRHLKVIRSLLLNTDRNDPANATANRVLFLEERCSVDHDFCTKWYGP